MPKWFVFCIIAMLNFGIWTLVARVAMEDLSPCAEQSVVSSLPTAVAHPVTHEN